MITLIFLKLLFKSCFWCPHFGVFNHVSNLLKLKGQAPCPGLCCFVLWRKPLPHPPLPTWGPLFFHIPPSKRTGHFGTNASPPDLGIVLGSRLEDREVWNPQDIFSEGDWNEKYTKIPARIAVHFFIKTKKKKKKTGNNLKSHWFGMCWLNYVNSHKRCRQWWQWRIYILWFDREHNISTTCG